MKKVSRHGVDSVPGCPLSGERKFMSNDEKYYRKSEFRYDTNPRYRNKKGRGHVVYVSR